VQGGVPHIVAKKGEVLRKSKREKKEENVRKEKVPKALPANSKQENGEGGAPREKNREQRPSCGFCKNRSKEHRKAG